MSKLCVICLHAQRALSRPNSHRPLELHICTISLYIHDLHVSDLMFEANHQALKVAISTSYHCQTHIISVHEMLFRDWGLRVCDTWRWSLSRNEEHSCFAKRNLGRLVLRVISDKIHIFDDMSETDYSTGLDRWIESIFALRREHLFRKPSHLLKIS